MTHETNEPSIPDDVVSRELDGELVVTSLSMGGFLRLDSIVTALTGDFDVDTAACRGDVEAFLDDLAERGLLNWRRKGA